MLGEIGTIIGMILINVAIVIGVWLGCVVLGAVIAVISLFTDNRHWRGVFVLGWIVGILLGIVTVIISLIWWGFWLM